MRNNSLPRNDWWSTARAAAALNVTEGYVKRLAQEWWISGGSAGLRSWKLGASTEAEVVAAHPEGHPRAGQLHVVNQQPWIFDPGDVRAWGAEHGRDVPADGVADEGARAEQVQAQPAEHRLHQRVVDLERWVEQELPAADKPERGGWLYNAAAVSEILGLRRVWRVQVLFRRWDREVLERRPLELRRGLPSHRICGAGTPKRAISRRDLVAFLHRTHRTDRLSALEAYDRRVEQLEAQRRRAVAEELKSKRRWRPVGPVRATGPAASRHR